MKVAIIGLGTVGQGVVKVIEDTKKKIEYNMNSSLDIAYVCDTSKRNFIFDVNNYSFITDYNIAINDDDVDVVVELIGGTKIAYDVCMKAIKNKKHVVTANKHLLAKYKDELFTEAEKANVKLFYEAAVGGTIPCLTPIKEMLIGNDILRVSGILNGTCNYILSKMESDGLSFDECLKEAQEIGYAEADPSTDILGFDTAHKIVLLSLLAYDKFIELDDIYVEGINKITLEMIHIANAFGYKIKLLAESIYDQDNLKVSVAPVLIGKNDLKASINGVVNVVEVLGSNCGLIHLVGSGAGRMETASSIVGDLMKIAVSDNWKYSKEKVKVSNVTSSKYFVVTKQSVDEFIYQEKRDDLYYSVIENYEGVDHVIKLKVSD